MIRLTTRADHADQQRNLRAEQNARKDIAPVHVRAEPVLRVGRLKLRVGKLVGIVRLRKRCAARQFSSATGQAAMMPAATAPETTR